MPRKLETGIINWSLTTVYKWLLLDIYMIENISMKKLFELDWTDIILQTIFSNDYRKHVYLNVLSTSFPNL